MPEMTFTVRWPDGDVTDCYSPSLVVHDHLETGTRYTVADFADRTVRAMETASDRVKDKYGFVCTSAAATSADVSMRAARYEPYDSVEVLRMWPPLPQSAPAPDEQVHL